MTDEQKFSQMLATDRVTYQNLVKARTLIEVRRKPVLDYENGDRSVIANASQLKQYKGPLDRQADILEGLVSSYNARQADIASNKTYGLGQQLTEFGDQATRYFSDLWSRFSSSVGLGVAPVVASLVVPLAYAGGAALALIAIAYFVSEHFDQAMLDQQASNELIVELAKVDPVLGDKALVMENALKEKQLQLNADTSIFSKIGSGAKAALIIAAVSLAGAGVYEFGRRNKWFK